MIPGWGRSPGERNGYPFQYSGLENSMDCIVHGVTKSWTQLNHFHFHSTANDEVKQIGLKLILKIYKQLMQLYLQHIRVVKVKVTQSCPTLCDPMDYTVHGILQARILEWVAIPFFRGSSQPGDQTQVSHIAGGFFTRSLSRPISKCF